MKEKFIDYYMKLAELTSTLSSAVKLKVGSVIVRNNQILATGYNGTPSGWDNQCELEIWNVHDGSSELKTKSEVIHSESNAILKVARSTESSDGATMFCTHAPCIDCAKLIYQSGINTLYYRDTYRNDNGIKFLLRGGVDVNQYPIQD
jgi:dCMP deaminase